MSISTYNQSTPSRRHCPHPPSPSCARNWWSEGFRITKKWMRHFKKLAVSFCTIIPFQTQFLLLWIQPTFFPCQSWWGDHYGFLTNTCINRGYISNNQANLRWHWGICLRFYFPKLLFHIMFIEWLNGRGTD